MAKKAKSKKSLGKKIKKFGKGVVIAAAGIVGTEVFAIGTACTIHDAKVLGKVAKETVNPSVYKVKQGVFKKAVNVTVNPISKTVKQYSGTKSPVNKKAIKLAKTVKIVSKIK